MTPDDYDAIAIDGYGAWLERFIPRAGLEQEFTLYRERFVPSLPAAFAAWEAVGIPVLAPVMFTIPFETLCGGRSMRPFVLDLHRMPDRVEAAMQAMMPHILESMRHAIRALGLTGCRLGGWRSASEFLSPKLWERFVFPYYVELCAAIVAEGVTPVFHFDSNWARDLARFREFPKATCVLSLDGATDIFKAKETLGRPHVPDGRRAAAHAHHRLAGRGLRVLSAAGHRDRPGGLHPRPGVRHPARRQSRERPRHDRGGSWVGRASG